MVTFVENAFKHVSSIKKGGIRIDIRLALTAIHYILTSTIRHHPPINKYHRKKIRGNKGCKMYAAAAFVVSPQ